MEFSEFAKMLKPIIVGEQKIGEFAQELFENIVDMPDTVESPLDKKNLRTFKAYYMGTVTINKFSKDIRKHIEPALFERYIYEMPEEAQMDIYKALAEYVPGMTDQNVAEKTAELFKSIISEASTKKRTAKKSIDTKTEENQSQVVGEKDYYLLDECNSSCPLCGDKLVKNIK